jgi:hypothetical protein
MIDEARTRLDKVLRHWEHRGENGPIVADVRLLLAWVEMMDDLTTASRQVLENSLWTGGITSQVGAPSLMRLRDEIAAIDAAKKGLYAR